MIPAPAELVMVFGIVALLFGAKKLPKLANGLGRSTKEFQRGRAEIEEQLHDE